MNSESIVFDYILCYAMWKSIKCSPSSPIAPETPALFPLPTGSFEHFAKRLRLAKQRPIILIELHNLCHCVSVVATRASCVVGCVKSILIKSQPPSKCALCGKDHSVRRTQIWVLSGDKKGQLWPVPYRPLAWVNTGPVFSQEDFCKGSPPL